MKNNLTTDQADELYALYLALHAMSSLKIGSKARTFEEAAVALARWQIVAISPAALFEVAKDVVRGGPKRESMERAHHFPRRKRADLLFDRVKPLSQKALFKTYFEHDVCTLVLKIEHKLVGEEGLPGAIEVRPELLTKGSWSPSIGKAERDWARDLIADLGLLPPKRVA